MELIHPDFPRISVDSEVCFGKPRVRGTRIPVASLLAYLAAGMSVDEIVKEFNWISKEDIFEAIAFASAMMQDKFVPLEKSL